MTELPTEFDPNRPSAARIYDYFLGGAHNFSVDRQLAEEIARVTPHVADSMRATRAFLRRAVGFLLAEGIDQFLDIGSGIPTVGNVHEVAPAARVIYVDVDPIAVAQSRSLLVDTDLADVFQADLRDPAKILATSRDLGLDFARPVGLLLSGVIHFVPDNDRPDLILTTLRDALQVGSYLALSHATADGQPEEMLRARAMSTRTTTEIMMRSVSEIAGYFGDFTVVEPGVVVLPLWRPDHPDEIGYDPRHIAAVGGVGRKDTGGRKHTDAEVGTRSEDMSGKDLPGGGGYGNGSADSGT